LADACPRQIFFLHMPDAMPPIRHTMHTECFRYAEKDAEIQRGESQISVTSL
jgi:hypothetical protein